MSLSAVSQSAQPLGANFAQIQKFQANLNYTETRQYEVTGADGQVTGSYSSAVTVSLSISAIHVTSDFLAAEQVIGDSEADDTATGRRHHRARGIENALQDLFKELKENEGLTSKVAKRLFKLVGSLNVARGTDKKLGHFNKEDRQEVRSARQEVNDFFRQKHAKVFVDQTLSNFISLVAKLETLREFVLRTSDLLSALKDAGNDNNSDDTSEEQTPLVNIEA
ncbi:MAG: hypothetical protein JKY91_03250 [Emcibacter sp.]|nr:hypothetical protein [Emcibacter sp.]